MYKLLPILFFTLAGLACKAQLETSADYKRQVYDREYTFGIIGHTRGYAINGRYMKFVNGYKKHGLEIDLTKLRHPKEVSSSDQSYSGTRSYVFNRWNSFYSLRTGYAVENILFDKTDQGTVSISLITSGGLSLGLLKPVYVLVAESGSGVSGLTTKRYNPSDPDGSTIYGEANFFKGIGETKLYPGIYAKVGANFDYQLIEKKVTSLEVGLIYDYFFREVPIFQEMKGGNDINWAGFFQMYVAFNFGYRKN